MDYSGCRGSVKEIFLRLCGKRKSAWHGRRAAASPSARPVELQPLFPSASSATRTVPSALSLSIVCERHNPANWVFALVSLRESARRQPRRRLRADGDDPVWGDLPGVCRRRGPPHCWPSARSGTGEWLAIQTKWANLESLDGFLLKIIKYPCF